jgi:hypothetical protein
MLNWGSEGYQRGGDDEEESRRRPVVVSFFAFRWPAFLPRTCSPDPWLLTSPHPDVLQLPCRAAHRRARQLQTEAGRRPYKCSDCPTPRRRSLSISVVRFSKTVTTNRSGEAGRST